MFRTKVVEKFKTHILFSVTFFVFGNRAIYEEVNVGKYFRAGQATDDDLVHTFFDVLLTMHLIITLANNQLDAQFLYFVISLLQSSTCFEQRRSHHQELKLY